MTEVAELMIQSVSNASIAYFGAGSRYEQGESRQLDPRTDPNTSGYGAGKGTGEQGEKKKSVTDPKQLTPAEKQQVEELKARDAEVRAHEMAHMAAAGSLAMGGPNYVYQTGPDGKNYAIGGDVKIDTSPGRTPEETIQKAQTIRAAALAPADPSPQDLKVASSAASMETQAAAKIAKKSASSGSNGAPTGEITSSRQLAGFAQTPNEGGETHKVAAFDAADPQARRAAQLYRQSSGF